MDKQKVGCGFYQTNPYVIHQLWNLSMKRMKKNLSVRKTAIPSLLMTLRRENSLLRFTTSVHRNSAARQVEAWSCSWDNRLETYLTMILTIPPPYAHIPCYCGNPPNILISTP